MKEGNQILTVTLSLNLTEQGKRRLKRLTEEYYNARVERRYPGYKVKSEEQVPTILR